MISNPGSSTSSPPSARLQSLLELRRWLAPERARLLPGALAVVLVGGSALAIPAALKRLLEALIARSALAPLVEGALLLSALFLVNGVAGYFQGVLFHEAAARVAERIRRDLVHHWLRWPLERHRQHEIGSLLAVSTADVEAVHQLVAHGLAPLVQNGLTFVGGLAIIAWIQWPIAVVLLAVLGLPALLIRRQSRRVTDGFRSSQHALEQASGVLETALAAIADVKLYGAAGQLEAAVSAHLETGTRFRLESQQRQSSSSQLLYVMFCLLTLVVFLGGGALQLRGTLDVAQVLILYVYAYTTALASISLYRTLGLFREARPAVDRLTELLAVPQEAADVGRHQRLTRGAIEVQGLEFRYPGQPVAVLEGLELSVAPGQWIVITGPSGSGKSTLLGLLARLYPIDRGEIRLDGEALSELALESVRRAVAIAPQAPGLFPGTLESNVRIGREELSPEALEEALEIAQLKDLPDLDARGLNLSSGQRARLGIARALVGDPVVLALDEATGPLDAATERAFWTALASRRRHRTTLIVTHRPERIPAYDALYRLEGRRLVRVHDVGVGPAGDGAATPAVEPSRGNDLELNQVVAT